MDPVTAIILSIFLSWGWTEFTNEPICKVEEIHNGKVVSVPRKCSEVLETSTPNN